MNRFFLLTLLCLLFFCGCSSGETSTPASGQNAATNAPSDGAGSTDSTTTSAKVSTSSISSASADASAGDWRMWRGPNGNNVATDGQSVPLSWSDAENVIWKVEVPGRGHSSPTVVDGRIYLTTADEKNQVQSVVCFDAKSGDQLWMTEVNRGGFPSEIHPKNTHASPTVASDGSKVYATFFNHGGVQCVAVGLDGKKVWEQVAGEFAPKQYRYGYAPSPTIYGSTLIVAADYDGGGFLAAHQLSDGKQAWKTPRPGELSYSSPIVTNISGRDQLLISGTHRVASYNPQSGSELWTATATTMATCGTMVWDGDLVFASGGYPDAETAAVKADGSANVVWRNKQKSYEQSMLAHNGYVYAFTDQGIAYCWKAGDGAEMWRARLVGPVSASPVLAGGHVFASNEQGTTFVFEASSNEFKQVAKNQLGTESFATPTICGNRIYIRVAAPANGGRQEYLYCIGNAG